MPDISPYEALILQARRNELEIIKSQEDAIMSVLSGEHRRLMKLLDQIELEYPSTKIQSAQLKNAIAKIESMMDDVFGKRGGFAGRTVALGGQIEGIIAKGMTDASKAAIDGKMKASILFLNDANPDLIPELPRIFGGIPEGVIRQLIARPMSDDKIFSQRLWNLHEFGKNEISRTLSIGVLQGKSAKEISKDLEAYLKIKAEGRAAMHGPAWKTGWQRGKVVYQTMRLARTEINNAFTETQIQAAMVTPWVKGMKWNLSASHKVFDICDLYASQDLFGLGKGCYPAENVPIRHPNCLCYLTDVLEEIGKVVGMLKEDLNMPKKQSERERIAVKELTPDQKAEKARTDLLKEMDMVNFGLIKKQ